MPQHKSCMKRMKTSDKSRTRNRAVKTVLRKNIKSFRDEDTRTPEQLKTLSKTIDKSASKGVIHKNKAARLKSRMAKLAAKAS